MPLSDSIAFGAPNWHIRYFANASAIFVALILDRGIAITYLVRLHCIVSICRFPRAVVRNGPHVSIETFSNASKGVSEQRCTFYSTVYLFLLTAASSSNIILYLVSHTGPIVSLSYFIICLMESLMTPN